MSEVLTKKAKETLILLRRFLKRIAVSMEFNCFIRKHFLCQGVLSPIEIANYSICLRWQLIIMAQEWAVSRRFGEWNASVVKTALKSVEIKTNSIVHFSRTLIHRIQCLTSTAQVRMVTDWNLKKFGHRFQVWTWYSPKISKNVIWIAFQAKFIC